VDKIVKSKSILTEECHLNEYLEAQGIEVVDTDLGERIVQLAGEKPSHIVLPCIHKKKEEIGELFHEHLGTPEGNADPQLLTEAARVHLREKFLTRRIAITGVNFAVAETGEFVVCTNEGNADIWQMYISPVWESKRSSRSVNIWACSCACWPEAPPDSRSPPIPAISGNRVRDRRCILSW
jgi:L-lactate utilization protein LutB